MKKLLNVLAFLFLTTPIFSADLTKSHDSLSGFNHPDESHKQYYIFSGNANKPLAEAIAQELQTSLGKATVGSFNDGEINVQFDENLRNKHVFIIQPTCTTHGGDVNKHLIEAMLMGDAVHRASCGEVTFVVPYFGYARQDRKSAPHTPISASVVAAMFEHIAGAKRIVTIDLHCGQIQGFFSKDVPVDNIYASIIAAPIMAQLNLHNPVIVSPDAGGVDRAIKFQKALGLSGMTSEFAMISKRRAKAGEIESMAFIGDVEGREAIIIDDMCDTGGTLCKAGEELLKQGAKSVYAFFTHPVFSNDALSKIRNSKFTKVFTTDTIPLRGDKPDNLDIISVAPLLAEVIRRVQNGDSVSEIFLIRK